MFWKVYSNLCLKNGISPNAAAKNMNISSGAVTEWKKGRIPQNATLVKISEYFKVPIDYLLEKDDQCIISGDNELKNELIRLISQMNDEQLKELRDYADYLIKK